ncbi:hypothetical protein ACPEIF_27020 [Streptomyces sp. NPDC012600]|uniref:hypothetical protein n=1 Tax=Streptomyces sp. NPDC012600 TaxID=3415005 RepID=UPI003C2C9E8F
MCRKPSRTKLLAAGLCLLIAGLGVSACSSQDATEGKGTDELAHRARQVAAAWDGSTAASIRRAGYYPAGEETQPPEGGLRTKADEQAYENRNFVLRGALPTGPNEGRVTWADAATIMRPLVEADASYRALAGRGVKGEPHLNVTGAELGEMNVATTRGLATVPAWLFTLDGYSSPLKQAAVAPSASPRPPIRPADDIPGHPIHQFVQTAADGSSVTVVALQDACEGAPVVEALETRGSVVLSAPVQDRKKSGNCTKRAALRQVTVKLMQPMENRLLLDALTGEPVPYRGLRGMSPGTA